MGVLRNGVTVALSWCTSSKWRVSFCADYGVTVTPCWCPSSQGVIVSPLWWQTVCLKSNLSLCWLIV